MNPIPYSDLISLFYTADKVRSEREVFELPISNKITKLLECNPIICVLKALKGRKTIAMGAAHRNAIKNYQALNGRNITIEVNVTLTK